MNGKFVKKLFISMATALTLLGSTSAVMAATYTQKSNALSSYNCSKFKYLNNSNYFLKQNFSYSTASGYNNNSHFQMTPDSIKHNSKKSNKVVDFKSNYFLPVTKWKGLSWSNPQSMVMTSADTAYVFNTSGSYGWITRYNLKALRALGAMKSGTMDMIRRATYYNANAKKYPVQNKNATYKKVLAAIKVGPKFKGFGHGQSLAFNPKDPSHLWFLGTNTSSGNHVSTYANVQQVKISTLKVDKKINFRLKSKYSYVASGLNLAFDKYGNAYLDSKQAGYGLKLYKGKIYSKSVKFSLVMQGLKYGPGTHTQSLAYNKKRNRLYMIADDSIISVPVSKLGKLKKSDVQSTQFTAKREFEGLQFTSDGSSYLLTNRGYEILKGSMKSF
ncbi:Extracellular protein [Pediococcus damnosus]|uniref:Extracellular protein n=2 Tax=Pediococcus damnosus TaxID=51663 RepID=A0AAC9B1Z0_9LACO|nr:MULTISPECIES: hypothetical protein [Pediococcus]AMV62800.1 Extracellular protein [Pediococcus damnosus]AMV67315.1 Extracellular protein [Pediococcus damnosus]AMV69618.1 Extracellular protein [Pediococcus damnosus]AVL00623.1 hypothetical protein PI20285_08235 [Pediococcus inopinatus]KJU75178.1 hypothetical protein AH70_06805 [Pediococcus damnosus LMG 28219]